MSYLQRGNKHREIYQKNLSLIKHRWAAVVTKLDPAQLLESVKLVTNIPYPISHPMHQSYTFDQRL